MSTISSSYWGLKDASGNYYPVTLPAGVYIAPNGVIGFDYGSTGQTFMQWKPGDPTPLAVSGKVPDTMNQNTIIKPWSSQTPTPVDQQPNDEGIVPSKAPAPALTSTPEVKTVTVEVIGTSPTTNEVLVKDKDGNRFWQPATAAEITKYQKALEENHEVKIHNEGIKANGVKLDAIGGDIYVPVQDWNNLDHKYRHIGLTKGFEAMQQAISKDNEAIRAENSKNNIHLAGGAAKERAPNLPELTSSELKDRYNEEHSRPDWQQALFGPSVVKIHYKGKETYAPLIKGEVAIGTAPTASGNLIKGLSGLLIVLGVASGKKAVDQAKTLIEDYQSHNQAKPTAANITAINTANDTALTLDRPKDLQGLIQGIPLVQQKGVGKTEFPIRIQKGEDLSTPVNKVGDTSPPGFAKMRQEVEVIMDPHKTDTRKAEDYMTSIAAVAEAAKKASKAAKSAGLDWDNVLNDIQVSKQTPGSSIERGHAKNVEDFRRALADYETRRRILEDAKKSYVASLNPSPVKGTISEEALYILAGHRLATHIKAHPGMTSKEKTELINKVSEQLSINSETDTKLRNALRNAARTATRTATRTQTRTQTKAQTKTATRTMTNELTRTVARTAEMTRTAERAAEATATTSTTGLKLPKGKSKEKTVHTAEDYAAAVAWKQGAGYWIVFPDKTSEFKRQKPEGVKVVPGPEANKPGKTIQVFRPKPGARPITFTADMGIQDVAVTKSQGPGPVRIQFRPDRARRTSNPVRLGQPRRFKSKKVGSVYRTKIGRGVLLSRTPLR